MHKTFLLSSVLVLRLIDEATSQIHFVFFMRVLTVTKDLRNIFI